MGLDIHTLIVAAAVLSLLIGLSLRYVLREYSADLLPSIRLWTLGILLQPTAWMLYGQRYEIPDWLSIVVANALLSLAFAKQIQALRVFAGQPIDPRLIYAPVVGVLLDEIIFTYAIPSMRLRLLTATPFFCAQMAYGGFSLLQAGAVRRRSHLLTTAAFFTLALVLTVRIVYEAVTSGFPQALSTSPMQTLVFGSASFFPLLATLGFVLMCSDRLHQELERRATRDPLTGIGNRRALVEQSAQAIALAQRHARPLALLLVDVDDFKHINDVHGHAVGDEALQLLAVTLSGNLRGEDLLGRLGGEEFVVVLPESDLEAALASAERLRLAVARCELKLADRARLSLRVSIGVATLRQGDDFAELLRRADTAMYAAKNAGRDCVRAALDTAPAQAPLPA